METRGACTGLMDEKGIALHDGDRVEIMGQQAIGVIVWLEEIKNYAIRQKTPSGYSYLLTEHQPRCGKIFRHNRLKGICKMD